MNRARKENESFEEYRASQDAESLRVRNHLSGRYIHLSKTYTAEGRPMPGVTKVGSFKKDQP